MLPMNFYHYYQRNNVVPNNVVPNNVVPNNVVPNNVVLNNVVPNNIVPNNVAPNNVVPNNVVPNTVVPNNVPNNVVPKNVAPNKVPAGPRHQNFYYLYPDQPSTSYYPRYNYYQPRPPYPIVSKNYAPIRPNVPKKNYWDSISKNQITQLKAQISAYKILLKSKPMPSSVLIQALGTKYADYQRMMAENKAKQEEAKKKKKLESLDQEYIRNVRDTLVKDRICDRLLAIKDKTDIKTQIEIKSLNLLDFQRGLRKEILKEMKECQLFTQKLHIKSYQKRKSQRLSEIRALVRKDDDASLKFQEQYVQSLSKILQHAKEFKEKNHSRSVGLQKIKKGVLNYFVNNERIKRKEQEKLEKERMRRLMAEDEDGYRKLIDEKKDSRLHYLLSQTDEFIGGISNLVKKHRKYQINSQDSESDSARTRVFIDIICRILFSKHRFSPKDITNVCTALSFETMLHPQYQDIPIDVINSITNQTLENESAPLLKDILKWLSQNRNWIPKYDNIYQHEVQIIQSTSNPAIKSTDISNDQLMDDDEYGKNESYYTNVHSIREKVTEQPAQMKMGGILKEYQIQGVEWLLSLYNNNLNGILADEMGLGKTIQTIGLICCLMERKKVNGPYLIIVPLSTISNWSLEFEKWASQINIIVYKGSPQFRKSVQLSLKNGKFNVVLTTYEYIIKDKCVLSKIFWKYVIIDEGHRMKNHHCKLTQILNAHYQTSHRLLLTGTPLQNNLPELWALLNFLLPAIFHSVSTFEQWFNAPFAYSGEKVELNQEESLLIIRRLHKVLRPFLLRRLKKEVEHQLPDKVEYVVKCEMSALQRTLYTHMQARGVILTDGSEHNKKGFGGSRTILNTLMQLRKICNHPFMFQHIEQAIAENNFMKENKDNESINLEEMPTEINGADMYRTSGKFELLDRILPKLKAKNHRVLLFCQMTSLMSLMGVYLEFRGFTYLRLDGSTKSEDREDLLRIFNANEEYFIFMLSTRAGGLGLNLQTADTVIIFDSDWNPHLDLQAQDRAHRIGQKNEVRVLRLVIHNSIEEKIMAAAKFKLNVDEKVIEAGMFDQKSTGNERRKFLQALLKMDDSNTDESVGGDMEYECPDNDTLNQMIARNEEEYATYQKIDTDRIWDEQNNPKRQSRLMQYHEMPDWIVKCDTHKPPDPKLITPLNSKRVRKEVNYRETNGDIRIKKPKFNDDNVDLDDCDYDEVEDDHDHDFQVKVRKPKYQKSTTPKIKDTSRYKSKITLSKVDGKMSRKRPLPSSFRMADREKRRKLNSLILPESIVLENKNRSKEFQRLINKLLEYKQNDGRVLCAPFVKLPTRRELPDYYEIIKKPMDFMRIRQKLRENRYRTLEELNGDVYLICNNAQVYNIDGSMIFEDSIMIQGIWEGIKQEYDEKRPLKSIMKKEHDGTRPGPVKRVTIVEEPTECPKEDPNEDPKDDSKEDTKEDPNQDPKEDPNQDPKEDPKEDLKEDPREEISVIEKGTSQKSEEPSSPESDVEIIDEYIIEMISD